MKFMFLSLLSAVAIAAIGMVSTAHAQVYRAEIIGVEPIYQTEYINTPIEKCEIVQVPVYGRTGQGASGLDVIGGALLGGLFGKAITDKDEGAVAGGLIGGAIAAEAGKGQRVIVGYQNQRQCNIVDNWTTQRNITHYNITYKWESVRATSKVYEPYLVGDYIPISVNINLVGELYD